VSVPCKLCERKRAKRYCPGVSGEICPSCCGAERENSIDCPLDCPYLREARLHERPAFGMHAAEGAPEELPNADIELTEDFIRAQEPAIIWLAAALMRAMEAGKAVDYDAREALQSLIKTYRTLESGLIYETRPPNPYAAAIQDVLKQAIEDLRKKVVEQSGMHTMRDADLLGVLVFLQRLDLQHNNGRRRGRAFFDFLRSYFPADRAVDISPAASLSPMAGRQV
jgi:hypothetical protein